MRRPNLWQRIKMMFLSWQRIVLPAKRTVRYVVVLGAGLSTEPEIGPAYKLFVDRAIELILANYCDVLCITGGYELAGLTEAKAVLEYLKKKYFGPVIVESRSQNTYENLREILAAIKIQEGHRPKEIILTTLPPHMGRAMVLAWALGIERVWPVPVKIPWAKDAVPACFRSPIRYRLRHYLACCHHLLFHFLHVVLGKVGISFSHPWL